MADKFTIGDDCWEWYGALNDAGYGMVYSNKTRRPQRVHRLMYEFLVGPIPDGLTLDHLCRNRKCVRPAHLEPVTRGENIRRGIGPQLNRERMLNRTHCKRGHLFAGDNLEWKKQHKTGILYRTCRTCNLLRKKKNWKRDTNGESPASPESMDLRTG